MGPGMLVKREEISYTCIGARRQFLGSLVVSISFFFNPVRYKGRFLTIGLSHLSTKLDVMLTQLVGWIPTGFSSGNKAWMCVGWFAKFKPLNEAAIS